MGYDDGASLRSKMARQKRKPMRNLNQGVKDVPKEQTRLEPLRSPQQRMIITEAQRQQQQEAEYMARVKERQRRGSHE